MMNVSVLSESGQAGLKAWSLRRVALLKEAIESGCVKPNTSGSGTFF